MSTSISRNGDISLLHPVVRKKVQAIQAELKKEKIPFEVFEAMRTPQRQAHLYAKGRTKPGNKVTWVKPWGSIHQYGLAVDFVLKINGNWSWDDQGAEAKYWDRMIEIAKANGMTPLYNKAGRLIEKPHVQMVGVSASELRKGHYPAGGDAAWANEMAAMIDGWPGAGAPPKPDGAAVMPGIAPDLMAEMEAEEGSFDDALSVIETAAKDAKFQKLHGFIKMAEGGFVSHPDDNDGGATNFGITLTTLKDWRGTDVTVEDVANMTQAEADAILRQNYYTRCRCGEMPDRVAMVVYNTAVMSGPGRAGRILQEAFNATGLTLNGKALKVDGDIGSNTMAAVALTDPTLLASKFIDLYIVYLKGRSNWGTFGTGWMNRMAKLREFLTTLPQGDGQRPEAAVIDSTAPAAATPVVTAQAEAEENRLLEFALMAATGGKSAVARKILREVLARRVAGGAGSLPAAIADHVTDRLPDRLAESALIEGLIDKIDGEDANKPKELTPVNAALGEPVGRLLDGKKSIIGIVGLVASVVLPELGILDAEAAKVFEDGDVKTMILTLFSLFTGWGFLGKIDKAIREVKVL